MNKKLKQLAKKAGATFNEGGHKEVVGIVMSPIELEKFTESIVKECLAECWYDATPKQIADNIKRKFGVEE